MSNIGCGAVALRLDKRSIIFYQPVDRKNSRMYYAGILYLYTQLLFLISAYTAFSYFFIRTYPFHVFRIRFYSVLLYAATISKFCVYNFCLFRYTRWPFLSSAYTTFAYFVIRTGHFTVLRMQFYPIFLRTRHLLSCVGIFVRFFPMQWQIFTLRR